MRLLRSTAVAAVLSVLAVARAAGQAPSSGPTASPSHRAAVVRLIEVTQARALMEQLSSAMLDAQLKQTPALAPVASVLRDFYREQLGWAVLEPELTRLYLDVFSEAEVRDLVAFYESPVGRKLVAKTPEVMARLNELSTRRVQAAMPQLMQRVQAALAAQGASGPVFNRFTNPWKLFLAGGDMAAAYDGARLTWRGDTAHVWVRAQYTEPQRYPGDSTRLYTATEIRLALRCKAGVARTERALVLNAAGDTVAGHAWPAHPWQPFAEHELSATILGDLCRTMPASSGR